MPVVVVTLEQDRTPEVGGVLLTSAKDIVRHWKEYFENLLNPTHSSFQEEAESGDEEDDPLVL